MVNIRYCTMPWYWYCRKSYLSVSTGNWHNSCTLPGTGSNRVTLFFVQNTCTLSYSSTTVTTRPILGIVKPMACVHLSRADQIYQIRKIVRCLCRAKGAAHYLVKEGCLSASTVVFRSRFLCHRSESGLGDWGGIESTSLYRGET
jgi:hypothetical protein